LEHPIHSGGSLISKILASVMVLGVGFFLLRDGRGFEASFLTQVPWSPRTSKASVASHSDFSFGDENGRWSRRIEAGSVSEALEEFVQAGQNQGLQSEIAQRTRTSGIAWSLGHNGQQRSGIVVIQLNSTHCAVYSIEEQNGEPMGIRSPSGSSEDKIPAPPWSKQVFMQNAAMGARNLQMYQCAGGGAEISRFYRDKLPSLGWELLKGRESLPTDEYFLTFQLGKKVCYVQIQDGSEQSLVTLILDRLQP
jgi:hypothetical protein